MRGTSLVLRFTLRKNIYVNIKFSHFLEDCVLLSEIPFVSRQWQKGDKHFSLLRLEVKRNFKVGKFKDFGENFSGEFQAPIPLSDRKTSQKKKPLDIQTESGNAKLTFSENEIC